MADRADPLPPRRRMGRRRLALLAAAGATGVAAMLAVSLWLGRNAVGERLAIDYLRRKGVPATVRLTRLDAGGVAGSLSLGPPSAPTLTVERFEADFAPGLGLSGRAPQVRRLVLVRPRVALRYDGARLDFGALQPLVDDALRAPPGGGPAPDVRVEDALVRLATPYGALAVQAAGELEAGRLRRADLRLQPVALRLPQGGVEALAGTLGVRAAGRNALSLQGRFTAHDAHLPGVRGSDLTVVADGLLPYRRGVADPFAGRTGIHAAVSAELGEVGGVALAKARGQVTLAGDVTLGSAPAFEGDGEAQVQADALSTPRASLREPKLSISVARLVARAAETQAQGRVVAVAAGGETRVSGERLTLGAVRASAAGRLTAGGRGLSGQADAALAGEGGFPSAVAARLAAAWAPGEYGADLRPPLARALTRVRVSAPAVRLQASGADWGGGWRVLLIQPARASAAGGATLTLAGVGGSPLAAREGAGVGGAVRVELAGGGLPEARLSVPAWRSAAGATRAAFAGEARGSAGPLRDARASLAGSLTIDGGGVRATAARCADLAFAAFLGDKGAPLATGASGRACPVAGAPLLAFAGGGWRTAAQLRGFALAAPPAKIALADADAQVRLQGRDGDMSGTVRLARAVVRDTDAPRRFNPLTVEGPARLARDVWTADLAVALAKPAHPLGAMRLTQDMRSGAGGLTLDAPALVFAPEGLQPAAVLPALAPAASEVSGPAQVTMVLGWKGEETTASVHVVAAGLQAKTAGGLVKGVKTDLTITGLDPLASAPGQTLTAERLETVVPLTELHATYALGKDVVELQSASATLAGGRVALDPMRVGLLPDATLTGVVRADGVQLGGLLDAVNLSRAVQIDAKLAGALPFSLGPAGLRFTDGRLAAMAPGGRLTLKREALTGVAASGGAPDAASGAQPSAVQDFAFQALEDLAFTELDAEVSSRPQGRLGVVFHITGLHDPPQAKVARVGLIDLIRGKAFDKPIPLPKGTGVNLTLDSSLNIDDLLAAYAGLSKAPGSAQVQP